MKRVVLLPNPSASGFTGDGFRRVLTTLGRDFDVRPEWAETAADVGRLARDAAETGADAVVAMGGDGTVHLAANGLIGTDAALGIIPAGTTNVVAKILGVPQSVGRAAEAIATSRAQPYTLARITGETARGTVDRYAVFAAGVGFDADVVLVAEQRPYSKLSFGALHYARSAISQVFGRYRSLDPYLEVEAGGSAFSAVAVMVQVHHVYTYFGRVPLYLSKSAGTGLTAAAIGRLAPAAAAGIARRAVFARSLASAPQARLISDFELLTVEAAAPAPFQADGEPLGTGTRFEVRPAPDAIRILSPT